MIAIREKLKRDDSGFTLVEVIVAMMIFAIISIGVVYSTVTAMRMTSDTRSRELATNLASAEIDAVRAIEDPFTVLTTNYTKTVGATTFTVSRSTAWVQGTGTAEGCRPSSGTTAGTLQYKRVNVTVSWPGQFGNRSSARADTILAPSSRLNDPSYGSILISVLGADGTGRSGVNVGISGDHTLTEPPSSTDADGCSYAFMVPPGKYTVKVTRAGYIDSAQSKTPSVTVSVGAGGAVAAAFQFDAAGTLNLAYPTDAAVPNNLDVSFFSTYGLVTQTNKPTTVQMHPFPAGYALVAGKYVAPVGSSASCQSVDPGTWAAATVNGKNLAAGQRPVSVPTTPTGASANVPMGLLAVKTTGIDLRLSAATAAAAVGDPGCSAAALGKSYTYKIAAAGNAVLAVPYGTWRLEELVGTSWRTISTDVYSVPTNVAGDIDSADKTATTVDPRALVTP